ncbi:MAG: RpiB/LacA/LacB family sugar-phosphate isomerase, partial [Actinobacteria bacterium]|nr:RpiB/LacA/LacB family sugar-phosphate isomerase [Actinomycetota bacterium]NIS34174.1 RpiB/LacA/LacB family sugar-phosphate isomerase [Actinomycetota bacterium]NIT97288.1 RpiB/LacA/LacB family sugar-phosphate isomerase [Actinomycetota bacterium]NIU20969.1 RpiB/LacA/LacB family sugar-phosphate isomerase [Actinomycetota bacterium]NIU68955.1 RpiB/LacA/LacB family sugar-phosphate isomerase [Actinomycetota bacterium]
GGFRLKERIGFRLREQGHEVIDCGTDDPESVDYPDFALAVAEHVAAGTAKWGIVVDGAGIGSCMAANK